MIGARHVRLWDILLWISIAGSWLLLYPEFHLSKQEFFLVWLSMFFFLGAQRFVGYRESRGLTEPQTLSRWWQRWRIPMFFCCGVVCLAALGLSRLSR